MPSLRRGPLGSFIFFVLWLTGCGVGGAVVTEPLRVGNVADLDPTTLGLSQTTTIDEARAAFQAQRLTGIAAASYARESGPAVDVLAADYQRRIHVFAGGKYVESLELPTHGLPPYGIALQLAKLGTNDVLLVLYRDPLARRAEPPTLLAYWLNRGHFQLFGRATFEELVERHGGMTSPILVGNDASDGVLLVARDRDGELWETGYLVRLDQRGLGLDPQPMTEALRCSCVRRYAAGLTAGTSH